VDRAIPFSGAFWEHFIGLDFILTSFTQPQRNSKEIMNGAERPSEG
jgi:hypothetical protein